MKRLCCFVLVALLLMSNTGTAFAVDVSNMSSWEDLSISETMNEDFSVTRALTRNDSCATATDKETLTNQLRALGYSQKDLDLLTEWEWEKLSRSSSIATTTTYLKIDGDGTTSTIPKKVAQYYSTIGDTGVALPTASGTDADDSDFIEVSVTAYRDYLEDGGMIFTATATWLTMPFFRSTDSLSIIHQECSVTPQNELPGSFWYAFYEYDMVYAINGITQIAYTTDDTRTYLDSSDMRYAYNGDFSGYGISFWLPINGSVTNDTTTSTYTYSNYTVKMLYTGHVRDYESAKYFNVIANYCHTMKALNFEPTFQIAATTDGEVSGTMVLTIGISDKYDNNPAMVEYHYVPE